MGHRPLHAGRWGYVCWRKLLMPNAQTATWKKSPHTAKLHAKRSQRGSRLSRGFLQSAAGLHQTCGRAILVPAMTPGVIHHSDHGSQYTSLAFGKTLREAGLVGSMGSVGDANDNAMAESFFATLKTELLDRQRWMTRMQLRAAIFDYIEVFYNRRRRHSALGHLSPIEFERRWLTTGRRSSQPPAA